MDPMENLLDPSHILLRTGWLKSLARSLVADDARADDIVQETWLAFLRAPPKHSRAAGSWLRSVVRNLAHRSHRAESRRGRHERTAARPERVDLAPDEIVEQFDLQRRLVELVAGLEQPYRSTVLLRFFEELSPGEIAKRQAVAVTTVRWRLGKALDTLRARLDRDHGGQRGAWRAAFLPLTGQAGQASSAGAPALVAATSSTTGSAATGLSTLAVGGILMAKKLTLSLGIALLAAFGAGVGVWELTSHLREAPGAPLVDTRPARDYQDLASRLRRAQAELQTIRTERDALALEKERLQAELQGLASRTAPPAAGPDAGTGPSPPEAAGTVIRWSLLASLVKKNLDLLGKSQRNEPLSEAEQAQLAWLGSEIQKISAQAKSLTRFPVLNRQFFDDLTAALLKDSLRLSGDQLARLRELNEGIFADLPETTDELSPLDHFRLRKEINARFWKGMEGILDEDQLNDNDWPALRQYSKGLLDYGDQFVIGTSTSSKDFLMNWIGNALEPQASPALLEPLTPAAEAYLREASALLERYRPGGGDTRTLSPEERAELDKEMLRLQERFHEEVQPLLSEDQRKKLSARPPLIIRIEPGNRGVSISNRWNPF